MEKSTKKNKAYTLLFIRNKSENSVLLGLKKRGFGEGKWNGFGGKIDSEINETVTQAAIREMKEEANIDVINPKFIGYMLFEMKNDEKLYHVHIFLTDEYKGAP